MKQQNYLNSLWDTNPKLMSLSLWAVILLLFISPSVLGLPHNRQLLQLTSNDDKSVSKADVLFYDPSHAKELDVKEPEEEMDDGLNAMKLWDIEAARTTQAPNLKEAFPDVKPEDLTTAPTVEPGKEVDQTDQSKDDQNMGPVQQSLAQALKKDLNSLYKAYEAEESLFGTVKALFEDYSMKGDSVATTLPPPDSIVNPTSTPEPEEEEEEPVTPSRPIAQQKLIRPKSPASALQAFFSKYDFEVDADVIQDKLFAVYNSVASTALPIGDEKPVIEDDEESRSHFHASNVAPYSTPAVKAGDLCDTTHDPRKIFKAVNFEDKREEIPEEDTILSAISFDIGEPQPKKNITTGSAAASEEKEEKEVFVPYFTQEEKAKYDKETVEEFYVRFISLKGTVIQPVILS